jgi:hypothetical protein
MIVLDARLFSGAYRENDSSFECTPNTVMIGRMHIGDENGLTVYMFASLKAVDSSGNTVPGSIIVENSGWSSPEKESSSDFAAPGNQVFTGRRHRGDENGDTWYKTGQIYFNNRLCHIDPEPDDLKITVKESEGRFVIKDIPMIRRRHSGDENGNTTYYFGRIVLP